MPNTFTHTPRPAHVSEGRFCYQRRFGPQTDGRMPQDLTGHADHDIARLSVYRDGNEDVAEVEMKIGVLTDSTFVMRFTPSELREAASRLLDAAHDIEAHPASTLAAEPTETVRGTPCTWCVLELISPAGEHTDLHFDTLPQAREARPMGSRWDSEIFAAHGVLVGNTRYWDGNRRSVS